MTIAVLLDLDGTLTDPRAGILGSLRYALAIIWGYGSVRELREAGADVLVDHPEDVPAAVNALVA